MKSKNFIFVGVFLLGLVTGIALPFQFFDMNIVQKKLDKSAWAILREMKEIWFEKDSHLVNQKTEVSKTGAEDCDAVALEFKEAMFAANDTKKFIEEFVSEQGREIGEQQRLDEAEYDESVQQYRDSVNRYFGRDSRPKPKND